MPEFCFTFHFQIFFMIINSYLGHKKRIRNGYFVSTVTNVIILLYCISYSFLCLSQSLVFKDFRQTVQEHYLHQARVNGYAVNGLIVFVTSLQIPFKFFVAKEFLFIMYDELRNYSLSDKVTSI